MRIETVFTSFIASETLSLDNVLLEKHCHDYVRENPSDHSKLQSILIKGSDNTEYQKLEQEVLKNFNKLHSHYGLKDTHQQVIKESWINIDVNDSISYPHLHPNCCFSAVYYVKAEDYCGNLDFISPIQNHQYVINEKFVNEYNEFTAFNRFITPKKGLLLLFPSWLTHHTAGVNNSKTERISIAFNSSCELTN